jgi:hypothetical protein
MLQAVEKTIDGITFSIMPLGGMAAAKMQHRLAGIVAPAFAAAESDLSAALTTLFERLPEAEFEAIIKALLYASSTGGKPLFGGAHAVFDEITAQRTDLVYKLIAAAIEVNYSGFFGALGESVNKMPLVVKLRKQFLAAKAEAPASSSKES